MSRTRRSFTTEWRVEAKPVAYEQSLEAVPMPHNPCPLFGGNLSQAVVGEVDPPQGVGGPHTATLRCTAPIHRSTGNGQVHPVGPNRECGSDNAAGFTGQAGCRRTATPKTNFGLVNLMHATKTQ